MTLTGEDDATFLRALAERIGTRVIVFVPNSRRPRSMWITAAGTDEEVDRLESLGRGWLAATSTTTDQLTRDADTVPEDASVAVAATGAVGAGVVGALVAAKDADGHWTTAERALLRFTADFYGPILAAWSGRPQPASDLTSAGTRARPVESGIRSAAANGEMFLVYQPEVDLQTSDIVAVEALVRWRHPERGELGPEAFIAEAEASDLIKILGAWVIGDSVRELAEWTRALPDLDITLRVNVSPIQLADQTLVPLIAAALAEHEVPGSMLCVEITENFAVADTVGVNAALDALRDLGVISALDDLSAGFSSLGRLRALHVDAVKIDRFLVSDLDTDGRARTIVAAVVRLAAELKLDLVAEGVERVEEAIALNQLGCRRAQGHHFGRPVDAAQMRTVLSERGRKKSSNPDHSADNI